ncbi:MAG: hypothetical protein JWP10_1574 [Nocardioidaceae bacterium]|nr:hypothetical protein [Nocardioidaceae bacterium]
MLMLDGVLGIAVLALWIFCLIDVITTDESLCRNLAKVWWLVIVFLFPAVGSIAWIVAGRPQAAPNLPYRGNTGFPEYERPGRFEGASPESDEDFLRQVRERAEEQRRRYREQKRIEPGEPETPLT